MEENNPEKNQHGESGAERPAQDSYINSPHSGDTEPVRRSEIHEDSSGEGNQETKDSSEGQEIAFDSRLDLEHLADAVKRIKSEMRKVIVGQNEMVDLLLVSILADGHSLIEGVPGIAKTVTAKLLAQCLSVDFSRIQFTPDLMPSDILGTSVFNLKTDEFEFKPGPIFSSMILIDEINRAPAKTQAALFESMAERQVTIDGKRYDMVQPFLVFATQNPVEQEGTYRLPEAQLDRFLFKINVGYPSLNDEIKILSDNHHREGDKPETMIDAVLSAEEISKYQKIVKKVVVEDNLLKYVAQITMNTRENPSLFLGASPRASIAMLNGSKAYAAMMGRDFVTPDDIKYISKAVLRHRIILTPEREMEGYTTDQVISQLLETVEVPR